ncbi:MAG: hypothetical protein ACOC6H_04915, partial [Thermoproteota archaeon]
WDNSVLDLKASYEGVYVRSISAADVDQDGGLEILTAGQTFDDEKARAQLSVWGWNGTRLVLEGNVEWGSGGGGRANSVYAYDMDNDEEVEIITGGYVNDLMNSSGQLCIWHWDGEEFSREGDVEWQIKEGDGASFAGNPFGNTLINNLKVGDVDGDGVAEVVTGGFTYDGEEVMADLRIWNWDGEKIRVEKNHQWMKENITEIKALALDDVDNDELLDIVTSGNTASYAGFDDEEGTPPETAQLKIWSWNGETLTLERDEEWQVGDGVCPWNVDTGDVDGDGTVEILTVGCMYVSDLCDPDLRIWSIEGNSDHSLYPILAVLGGVTALVLIFLFLRKRRD